MAKTAAAIRQRRHRDRRHRGWAASDAAVMKVCIPRHLCGLTIIWGLQPGAPGHWTGGWLYDPQDGVTYDVTAELTSPTTISARVYRGVPLFGRTEILIRDPQLSFDGRC